MDIVSSFVQQHSASLAMLVFFVIGEVMISAAIDVWHNSLGQRLGIPDYAVTIGESMAQDRISSLANRIAFLLLFGPVVGMFVIEFFLSTGFWLDTLRYIVAFLYAYYALYLLGSSERIIEYSTRG